MQPAVRRGRPSGDSSIVLGSDPRQAGRRPSDDIAAGAFVQPVPPAIQRSSGMSAGRGAVDSLSQLESRVRQQQVELESRTDNVNAIQRNFLRLSDLYDADKRRLAEVEERCSALAAENESLRAEKKLFAALRAEFVRVQEALEDGTRHQRILEEQLGTMRTSAAAAAEREHLLEGRNERLRSRHAELQRVLFVDVSRRVRAIGTASAAIIDAMEGAVDASSVLGPEANGDMRRSTAESLRACLHTPAETDIISDGPLPCESPTELGRSGSPTPPSRAKIGAGLTETFAARVSNNEGVESSADTHTDEDDRKGAIAARKIDVQPLNISALKAERPATSDSPQRQRKRTRLLFSQLDALAAGLNACESEVLPCVTYFLRANKSMQVAASTQHSREVESLRRSLERLQSELTATRESADLESGAKRAAATKYHEERLCLQREISLLRDKLERALSIQKDTAHDLAAGAERLRDALRVAEDEAQQLRVANASSMADLTVLQAKYDAVSNALTEATKEKDLLLKAAAREGGLREGLAVDVEQARRDTNDLRSRLGAVEAKLSAAEAERRTLQESATLLEGRLKEAKLTEGRLNDIIADRSNQLRELEEQLSATAAAHAAGSEALEDLKKRLGAQDDGGQRQAQLEGEVATLRGQVAAMGMDLRIQQNIADARREKEAALTQEIQHLHKTMQEAQEAAAGRVHALRAERDAEVTALRREADALRKRADDAEAACSAALSDRSRFEAVARTTEASLAAAKHLHEETASKERTSALLAAETEEKLRRLAIAQKEAANALKKLVAAEESSETSLSCQACLQLLSDPVVCAPCGHAFCRRCLQDANANKASAAAAGSRDRLLYCPECDRQHVQTAVSAKNLDLLASKFSYRKGVLKDLAALISR